MMIFGFIQAVDTINENAQVEFSRTDTQVVSFLIVLVVMCNNCQ